MNKMSKADKFFEQIGYIKIEDNSEKIRYRDDTGYIVEFYVKDKLVSPQLIMNLKQLQAIIMKCKELKWL